MPQPRDVLSRYLSKGQIIAQRYQLQGLVGEGAYGAIYQAVDTVNHDVVAVKALPPRQENTSSTALGRFKREMAIIHNLVHPHIVTLFDYGETPQGVPFMVMEYIEGITLEQCVRHRPMSFDDGLEVFYQIASALGAAHAIGIVHRDLKPANIMIRGEQGRYEVKMLDFGMAKVFSQLGDETVAALTREGMAVGTPRYIAPEQARGLQVGPFTDLYALGLLGYEIFTGERVVKHDDIEGAVMAHVSPQPLPLPEFQSVPNEMRAILLKLMEKDPRKRYQRAEELLPELDRLRRERRMAMRGPLRAQGAPAPLANPSFAQANASSLDIDYDRLEQANKIEYQARQEQFARQPAAPDVYGDQVARGQRAPGRPLRVLENIFSPLTVFISFTLMAAHLNPEQYLFSVGLGLFPFVVAGLIGWLLQDKFPFIHPGRVIHVTALLGVVGAHLAGMGTLKTNLMMRPMWFLKPLGELLGFTELCTGIARAYVELLSTAGF